MEDQVLGGELAEMMEEADKQLVEAEESEEEEEYLYTSRPMLKPTFVSKKERETIVERQQMEDDEVAYEEAKQARLKERKLESRELVIKEVEREEEMKAKGIGNNEEQALPDDTDGLNEEEEIEQWKIRELKRIKRDR